jgi:hypothetical protein
MGKTIIIEPCFCEAHLLKQHICNVCDYLKPNIYIISEGIFPKGPEDKAMNVNFRPMYTLKNNRSFDFERVVQIIEECKKLYPNTDFRLIEMNYEDNLSTQNAYLQAYTAFPNNINIGKDDIIFPMECDLFFTQDQAETILEKANKLKPEEGFGCSFLLFFESPRVCIRHERTRKICVKYGNGSTYNRIMGQNFNDTYQNSIPIYNLKLFHYEWIRPGKYFNLRLDQLVRHPTVQATIISARNTILSRPKNLKNVLKPFESGHLLLEVNGLGLEDHPKQFHNHEKMVYYYGNN